jgi:hypothetical protein
VKRIGVVVVFQFIFVYKYRGRESIEEMKGARFVQWGD